MPRPAPTVPRFYPPERHGQPDQALSPAPPDPPARSWKRRVFFRLLRWGFIASVWLTLAAVVTVLWYARDLPRPESALDAVRRPSLTLEDRSGHVIATYGDLVGEPLAAEGFFAIPAGSHRGGGGPPVLAPRRHRPDRAAAGRLGEPDRRAGRAGRLDPDAASRENAVPDQCTHHQAESAGVAADAVAGAAFHQAGDPRDLSEPRLPRRRRLGDGCGGEDLFQCVGTAGDAGAGGGAGGVATGAVAVQSAGQSGCGLGTGQGSAGRDGRCRHDHRGTGQGGRGADRVPAQPGGVRLVRRLGGGTVAGAAGAGHRRGAAHDAGQPRTRRWPKAGWRRCWTVRARRPTWARARWSILDARHRGGARHGRRAEFPHQPVSTARCWLGGSRGRRSSRSSG